MLVTGSRLQTGLGGVTWNLSGIADSGLSMTKREAEGPAERKGAWLLAAGGGGECMEEATETDKEVGLFSRTLQMGRTITGYFA